MLIILNAHNIEIKYLTNAWEIMVYNGGASWYYLILSIVLIVMGSYLLYCLWKAKAKIENMKELILIAILSIIIILLCILIIYLIQNPILRAVCIVIFLGGMGVISLEE